jgi:hypothetical protein
MNKTLLEISKLLEKNDIKYSIDSGTLLGIIREGDIINGDDDIDFISWENEIKKIKKILPEFEKMGYSIVVEKYENLIYSFILIPKRKNLLEIDIKIFRESINYSWCPVMYARNSEKKGFLYWKSKLFRVPFLLLLKVTPRGRIKNWLRKIIWNYFFVLNTWVVSKKYLSKDNLVLKKGLFVPKTWKKYLDFKYGNWRIPNPDWNYVQDDKTLIHKTPKELKILF